MKTLKLMGEMVLLISMFLACTVQNQVNVLCSPDWFMVSVHPYVLIAKVYVYFHELHLGLGCPPNHVRPHIYEFTYRVTECGIRAEAISENEVMYSSELYYASKGTKSTYMIPVSCITSKQSPWLTSPCPMPWTEDSTVTQNDETDHEVFTLTQCTERPNCDCPPYVLNEEEHAQAPQYQAEAQGAYFVQSPYFVDLCEDWSLRSDDLIGSM
ncbi:placenta-specific protein 1 [Tupaia chinensis]|uniref:Placenta-specific protein 1 n=1 Tax=Tupaia chinensis TaxID=246437 RepID=L8Y504_TUPCH|nr:placenta-specific protein 1 [Tupaia chinensis]ELV09461.1 Placenta-specific protein 1 [Tupaia chinensis]